MRLSSLALLVLMAAGTLPAESSRCQGQEHRSRTEDDQDAMWRFEPFLGVWVGEDPANEIEFSWGIEGKTLFIRHHRVENGERKCMAEAMVGWHYGERRLVFHEFVRDERPFEVMGCGAFFSEAEGVLRREFRAYDPDGSSRAYREWYIPGDGTWSHRIEYQADDGAWKPWNTFAFRLRE